MTEVYKAVNAPTQYAECNGRRLAYRDFGAGVPIVLCVRFRGTMDSWDPSFLDGLVGHGFRVIVFDYSGLGASTGVRTYNPQSLAKDALDLMDVLALQKAVIGGWSIGGVAAQIVLAKAPQRVSHVVLLATTPPGPLVKAGDPLFFKLAKRDNSDPEDAVALFFEPNSAISRAAAKQSAERLAQRQLDISPPVPREWAGEQLGDAPRNPAFPADAVLRILETTTVPVLHIGADHDLVFPVENWYALTGRAPTLQLITLPQAGHGPHHQYPATCAGYIAAFLK
ncbi:alpha/beta hydrolase [Paraburkholderia terrae]|uniref:alpha/beta fold hydrolase n=1 Tax=Paraburkholderia TaxID=1822464 RepID=UPI001EE28055|nr:alpha/beta hydrolase [Paraburkholderia terrae]BEU21160.1 alpha/beta hydrolase [Paraburkholderia sp. 22B1P]GJH06947.1 alpha/beta fold hydrolase [Paraburkholderia terrae]GJH39417.1 alpha/beta fold hydrolase [Paraburkholderia hospita]